MAVGHPTRGLRSPRGPRNAGRRSVLGRRAGRCPIAAESNPSMSPETIICRGAVEENMGTADCAGRSRGVELLLYQRLLGLDEVADLLPGQGVLPDSEVPGEVHQTLLPDDALLLR